MLPTKVLQVNKEKEEVVLGSGNTEYTVRLVKNEPRIVLEMTHAQIYDSQCVSNAIRSAVLRRAAAILKEVYRPRPARLPRQLPLPFPF